MTTIRYPLLFVLALLTLPGAAVADESKELRKQRQLAQKERQQLVQARNKEVNEATQALRQYARDLKMEHREQVKELDTEFELQRVELEAEHDARVAGAEAEYQKKVTGLFMTPGVQFDEETVKKMQGEAKVFADAQFALKKQSAEELHAARIANEERKNALLDELDQMMLAEAENLGLTKAYAPVVATAIGDVLTKQEERWNDRENKAVEKLIERNRKTLAEYRNGAALRQWNIENLNEDFMLAWEKKAKLHELESQQGFYNTLFMVTAQSQQFDQQELMAQLAELGEKKKLIDIEYRKIRDKNRITRREERKEILAN